jgi:hypothetical protein
MANKRKKPVSEDLRNTDPARYMQEKMLQLFRLRLADIYSYKDYPDRIGIVTNDGKKLIYTKQPDDPVYKAPGDYIVPQPGSLAR